MDAGSANIITPYMMYFYADKIRSHPVFAPLLPKLLSDCKDSSMHRNTKLPNHVTNPKQNTLNCQFVLTGRLKM